MIGRMKDKVARISEAARGKARECRFSQPTTEMEFLPAALEVVETPPSPIGRATAWCIMILVVLMVFWAVLGKTDVVAVAEGKIIPSGRVKTIQPLESGVITKINVHEGQLVKAGDLLIELDTTTSGADVERLQGQLNASLLEEARLEALLSWDPESGGMPELVVPEGAKPSDVMQEKRYLGQDAKALLAKLNGYDNEVRRLTAKRQAAAHTVEKLKEQLPIITKRANARKKLYDQDVGSENDWLQVESERIEIVQNLKTEEQELAEAEASIDVAQEQRLQALSEYSRDLLEDKTTVSTEVDSLTQELKKAAHSDTLQRITAPVDGKVMKLAVHTIGGVVTPAQELMTLVPRNYQLEIEAKVKNKDIGFVREGQEVGIKLEAFPFTEYGTLDGTVQSVSGDAIQTEEGDLYFLARVGMKQSHIMVNGRRVNLTPGMRATAEVKIRQRRLIEFFLSPLLKYTSESMKER
ncbi:HlyD family type I secretion periplasmic adaptor subunit [Salidesulfovibrio onnuriiensis]|uniref:HlyD family type I secretion periplasmic adaptor subunit n=1 Tax=Salidesulfovibrio onnuriiensis TaxID=2583823 RepID=UPI0011C74EBA|nr:HlyD family type I secretion periplasmic adaptor subunit [Salidesulfovibrio onnuriiensis]